MNIMTKLLTTVVIFFCIALCSHAYGATIIVPTNYPTIQDAVNNASSGDTVLVKAGTYSEDIVMKGGVILSGENVTLFEQAPVKIVGSVTTASNTELKGLHIQNDCYDKPVVDVAGQNILIRNCSIKNLGTVGVGLGIAIKPAASNVSIKNVIVQLGGHAVYDRGISINHAGPITIQNTTVHVEASPDADDSASTACVYSDGGSYTVKDSILTLNDPQLKAIEANSDTPEVSYNCILGRISPINLAHKGTISAAPGYKNTAGGDFHIAMASDSQYRSPSLTVDAGCPQSAKTKELQVSSKNKAVDIGSYGNTPYSVATTLRADPNVDGVVNVLDLILVRNNLTKTSDTAAIHTDINKDGKVNVLDLIAVRNDLSKRPN